MIKYLNQGKYRSAINDLKAENEEARAMDDAALLKKFEKDILARYVAKAGAYTEYVPAVEKKAVKKAIKKVKRSTKKTK